MVAFLKATRDICEVLYFLSGIVLAGVALYALQELKFHKDNAIRAAATETAKQCDRFIDNIIPLYENICEFLDENNISSYDGKIDKFSENEIEVIDWIADNCAEIENDSNLMRLLNQVEAFAIYFIHGICDEDSAYYPISTIYIEIVEKLYPHICCSCADNSHCFSNLRKLYTIWKTKKEKEELLNKSTRLYEKSVKLTQAAASKEVPKIKTIGVEFKKKKK